MVMRFIKTLVITGVLVMSLSGCWDEHDVEDRNFVVGSAIDLSKGTRESSRGDENDIQLTNQFIDPGAVGTPEDEGEDKDKFRNVSVDGENSAVLSQNVETMTSRLPFYGHSQILILSDDLAKKANYTSNVVDQFLRDIEIRRALKVFVADGKAKDMLQENPMLEDTPSQSIDHLIEKTHNNIESVDGTRIGTLQSHLLGQASYVIPMLTKEDDDVQSQSGAVFHGPDNKMVGHLNEDETKGYNLAKEKNRHGMFNMTIGDDVMVFQIDRTTPKLSVDVTDPERVDATIHVNAQGFIAEMFGSESLLTDNKLDKIGNQAAKKIEKLIKQTITKSQSELHADILGVGDEIQRKHYGTWKKIRGDWEAGENYFDNTNFHVKAHVRLKDVGSTDRTKKAKDE